MKPYILIVEDKSILYENIRQLLINQEYNVSLAINSYDKAIDSINIKKPDLVLIDVNLKGDNNGLDLGKVLNKSFKIPFIYISDSSNEDTFNKALHTHPNSFEILKTPNLGIAHLLHSIKIVLNDCKCPCVKKKKGLMVYVDYLDEIKLYSKNDITRVPICFKDIAFITTENYVDEKGKLNTIKHNYVRLETLKNDHYFYKSSLKNIIKLLPIYFMRINESTIVNLSLQAFKGRINGRRLVINNHLFTIKETFASEVKKRIDAIYQN